MTLGRCLEVLRWNQQHRDKGPSVLRVVPYRESKVGQALALALCRRPCICWRISERCTLQWSKPQRPCLCLTATLAPRCSPAPR